MTIMQKTMGAQPPQLDRRPPGRKKINVRYIKVGLPDGVAERIDQISNNRRADYIRTVVVARLIDDEKIALEQALEAEQATRKAQRKPRKAVTA